MFFLAPVVLLALSSTQVLARPSDSGLVSRKVTNYASSWYAGWHATAGFPPESVSWDKYTSLTFAFAETTPNIGDLTVTTADDPTLRKLVQLGKQHGVSITISIGGWTGSRFFSSAVATASNRTAFVKAVTNIYHKYDLAGIDFDWEYPNVQGLGCNTISSSDTANFLKFLQQLRASPLLPKTAVLTAAVATQPFADASGNPSKDVSGFAKVLDHIAIMNYDLWGSWTPTTGPNAPLNDTCVAKPAQSQGSAVSAFKAWNTAGIPANQIVLAVGSYGHSFQVKKANAYTTSGQKTLNPYSAFNAAAQPAGDKWDDEPGVDACGVAAGRGGVFNFWGLIEGGFLDKSGKALAGIDYLFDKCSQTPFVYNSKSGVFISYDDAISFAAKGKWIASKGLRGFSIWETGGDYNNILLNAIRSGAGF